MTLLLAHRRRAYREAVFASAPAHHWPLSEASGGAIDRAGGLHLTYGSAVGRSPLGLIIDNGCSSHADAVNNAITGSSPITPTLNQTVEAWIRTTGGTSQFFVLNRVDVNNLFSFRINSDSSVNALWRVGGTTNIGIASATNTILAAVTYHIVARIIAGVVTLWINGVSAGVNTVVNAPGAGDGVLRFASNSNDTQRYTGLLDEVAVFNRGIADAEIRHHYFAGLAA